MRTPHKIALASSLTLAGIVALAASSLTSSAAPTSAQAAASLTVYAGRSEPLVEPLVEAFQKDTGIKVNVRYGTDAALYAALSEEGSRSPADVFWANTSGALVNASQKGYFVKLPAATLKRPLEFAPKSGTWTPLSVRFRVLAFNPKTVKASELPASVLDLTKLTKYKTRIGWTPTYSSFQDFVTALRVMHGEAKTKTWLEGMKRLEPKAYTSNSTMLEAMLAGEIDVALTNHYYVQRIVAGAAEGEFESKGLAAEEKPKTAQVGLVGAHFFKAGDTGNLELVTGAAILKTSKQVANARKFVDYLLSQKSQQLGATTILEYPVVGGFALPKTLGPLTDALKRSPKIDFERLSDLEGSLKLLRSVGLL
jgi:iron(III) transport system substrate-binding protein